MDFFCFCQDKGNRLFVVCVEVVMSTEIKLEQILKRVEQGLTTYADAVWLKQYYTTLQNEVLDYSYRLKAAEELVESLEYYATCNE